MAKFTLKADNFCFLSRNTNAPASLFSNTSCKNKSLYPFSSKRSLKFRVLCSVKEKENVKETEKVPEVLSVLRVDELEQGILTSNSGWNWPPWENIPQRYKLIATTSLAFVICNMDKVNLSVAIIPMSHQFGWNSSVAGLVQSSFFWGYALSQLPGGWLAKIFGGRKVLEIGVLTWSLATALVPVLAGFMPGLILSRTLVGIGEGVSPSAATDLIARFVGIVFAVNVSFNHLWQLHNIYGYVCEDWHTKKFSLSTLIFLLPDYMYHVPYNLSELVPHALRSIPLEERSRAVAFVFGGLSVGSVSGLLLAAPLIQNFGWESVFYIFGFVGIAWFLTFHFLKDERTSNVAEPTSRQQHMSLEKIGSTSLEELGSSLKDVPWNAFFRTPAVWAMIYAHFCGSWGHYTCLSWLPSYFSEELNLNLTEASWVSILPPLASIFVTSIASQFADNLIANGAETTSVRKICQTVAFLSPAVCMTLSSVDLGLPPWEVVGILTGGLALSSFALSGLYCTHQDMSPQYASILLGITNTVGAIPGIVGVALTGYLLDATHSWSLSLFAPSIFFYLTGTIVWLAFASSEPQNFSKEG